MDMLVDGAVVIENKAREPLDPDAQGQLFAGLAATNLEVGLVLHFCKKSALRSRLLRKSVQATQPAVPVVAVAVPFYESECQEQTSSRQGAEQKLLWHSALNLDGARQSGPNAGVGSTTSFLA